MLRNESEEAAKGETWRGIKPETLKRKTFHEGQTVVT